MAEAVDAEFHHVAGLEPDLGAEAHADPGRGAGVDEVAGLQDHELADVVDDEVGLEDHRRRGAGLAADAVDVQPHAEGVDVGDLVLRGQPGSGGVEGLGGFALEPLAAALHLERALGDVVHQRPACDVVTGLLESVEVAGALADDDAELDLPVGLGGAAGDAHVVVRADQGVRGFGEQDGLGRDGLAGLGGVVGVVQPHADDLVRAVDRCAQALAGEGFDLAALQPLRDDRADLGQATGAEECLVEVADDVGEVDVAVAVDQHGGLLGAGRADTDELHFFLSMGVRSDLFPLRCEAIAAS